MSNIPTHQNIQIQTLPTVVDGETVHLTNARDLHKALEVQKDFSDWIKAQIKRARLLEGRDFVVIRPDCSQNDSAESSNEGSPKKWSLPEAAISGIPGMQQPIEYHLTPDACKHVAMISNTERGFAVREYYIALEKHLKARHEAVSLAVNIHQIAADIEAHYEQHLKRSVEYELGEQLLRAVAELSTQKEMTELEQAAREVIAGEQPIKNIVRRYKVQVGALLAEANRLELAEAKRRHLKRGEHLNEDMEPILSVLTQAKYHADRAGIRRARPYWVLPDQPTWRDEVAHDMLTKHLNRSTLDAYLFGSLNKRVR